jgi:hypothetical protein
MMNLTAPDHLESWPRPAHDAAAELAGLSKTLHDTVNIAAGLAAGGRRVDVAGLDRSVGLFCAKALDLPPVEGHAACALLFSLLSRIDALGAALRATNP